MKQSFRGILSFVFLLTLVGQLIVISSSYFFSDENLEENVELRAEDIFDDEIENLKFCYFDWMKRNPLKEGSFDLFHKSNQYFVKQYPKIVGPIQVPPPEVV